MFYFILLAGLCCFLVMAAKAWKTGYEGKLQGSLEAAKGLLQKRQDKLSQLQFSTTESIAINEKLVCFLTAAEEKQQALLQKKEHWKQRAAFIQNQHLTESHTLFLLQQGNDLTENTFYQLTGNHDSQIYSEEHPNGLEDDQTVENYNDEQITQEEEALLQIEQEQQALNQQMLENQHQLFGDQKFMQEEQQERVNHQPGPDMIWDEMHEGHANGMGFHPFDQEQDRLTDESLNANQLDRDWDSSYGHTSDIFGAPDCDHDEDPYNTSQWDSDDDPYDYNDWNNTDDSSDDSY